MQTLKQPNLDQDQVKMFSQYERQKLQASQDRTQGSLLSTPQFSQSQMFQILSNIQPQQTQSYQQAPHPPQVLSADTVQQFLALSSGMHQIADQFKNEPRQSSQGYASAMTEKESGRFIVSSSQQQQSLHLSGLQNVSVGQTNQT